MHECSGSVVAEGKSCCCCWEADREARAVRQTSAFRNAGREASAAAERQATEASVEEAGHDGSQVHDDRREAARVDSKVEGGQVAYREEPVDRVLLLNHVKEVERQ